MDINLTLDVNEVNAILRSFGKHPFDEIVSLITKIKSQGEPQVQAAEEPQPLPQEVPVGQTPV